tara:strand:- start:454 stop:1509 length:1056 start_codon:yes stop_codon:yes gene_type:complete
MPLEDYGEGFVPVKIKDSSQASELAWEKIQRRRNGEEKYVDAKYHKTVKAIKFDFNRIYAIGGASSFGKSVVAKDLVDSILDENEELDPMVIYFNGEMLSSDTILRSVCTEAGLDLSTIESENEAISDQNLDLAKEALDSLSSRENVFFVDEITDPERMFKSIRWYYEFKCRPSKRELIVVIDHILLTSSTSELNNDNKKIEYMSLESIKLKKEVFEDGGKIMTIFLSQLNRNNKDEKRITKSEMHPPMVSDIYGGSQLEMACDAMMVVNIPHRLGIHSYTTQNLPTVVNVNGSPIEMAYLHVIKSRHGGNGIMTPLVNKLKYFTYEEMDLDLFKHIKSQFNSTGVCNIDY